MEDLDIFIYTPHLQKHLKSVSETVKLLLLSDKNNKSVGNISICKSVVGGGGWQEDKRGNYSKFWCKSNNNISDPQPQLQGTQKHLIGSENLE